MKYFLVLAVVAALANISFCQVLPEDSDVIACIQEGVNAIADTTGAVAEWTINLWETVNRLLAQYRRCQEIDNDRLQQTCMATWAAQVLFEANRLRNDLARVAGIDVADAFYEHFLSCFGNPDPDAY